MSAVSIGLAVLGVWRVTHLLVAEDGPWDLVVRLRSLATGALARMLDCFYCASVWVAMPVALGLAHGVGDGILLWAGLSGGACLLERATDRPVVATWLEGGHDEAMLRAAEDSDRRASNSAAPAERDPE